MSYKNAFAKLKRLHQRLNGNTIHYDLREYQPIVLEINKLTSSFKSFNDNQLKALSNKLLQNSRTNEIIDTTTLLIEAYAIVYETIQRVLKICPFDVQLIGAIVLNQGKIAEMQTGEGKTLAAVFPAYLNALSGKGVHILTFNDYLARRDAEWMSPVYNFLGITVGFIQEGMDSITRQKAYKADVTYLTAKESGFDFLRDSVCLERENMAHRAFNYAIIDEADSILIDEARIPLVLAQNTENGSSNFASRSNTLLLLSKLARELEEKIDFNFDEYHRNIYLTDHGLQRVETFLKCGNIYEENNWEILSQLNHALHAHHLLQLDKNYIVRNGFVELVDEFTGRVAFKRQWPEGLQTAVEAKEDLINKSNGTILNSIALQHFLQLYPKLCGMTATAQCAQEEFREFYGLSIVVIPANRTCIRKDLGCIIYATKKDKMKGIINEIVKIHKINRPVLVGTESIKDSTEMAKLLLKKGVTCEVLNAKNDDYEAKIIALAGKLGAITISTNMAGRGTDIRLGPESDDEKMQVLALGGLYVIGTAKYESRRIDDQLRGRAGRQGDPGACKFFISLEDDLFIKYRLRDLLPAWLLKTHLGRSETNSNDPNGAVFDENHLKVIDSPYVNKEIDRVQRIIEGQNLEIKKTLWNYSYLIEQQRQILFEKRNNFLKKNFALDFFKSKASDDFSLVSKMLTAEEFIVLCKGLCLGCIDTHWSKYLADVTDIREGIHLRRIGGQNPLFEFQKIIIELFEKLLSTIEISMLGLINNVAMETNKAEALLKNLSAKLPSSTWTYMINDNPFDPMLEVQLSENAGLSVWAGMLWPLLALYFLLKKRRNKMGANNYLA